MSKPTDLVQGTLDLLILKVVALDPMHGWAIAQRISQMSNDILQVGQGSLYPALHKLEQQGWIEAEWRDSENNRRAKYYTLTREGRRALKQGPPSGSGSRRRFRSSSTMPDVGMLGCEC
jgi:PadR family transcriptional regulator PadR